MKPVGDKIFIKLSEDKKSSLFLTSLTLKKNKANQGEVLAVGDLVQSVQKGDEVMFHPFDELETPSQDIVVIREKSLLAILNKKEGVND